MRYLLFVSLLFTACSSSKKPAVSDYSAALPFWTSELMNIENRNDFRMILTTSKIEITGICVVKNVTGEWRGSIMNEFGAKAFDFISTPQKCKLVNVISFIDKWYIKKTIAADIQFIMEVDNPVFRAGVKSNRYFNEDILVVKYKKEKELQRFPDGEIKYKNHKRSLTYSFKVIN